MSALAFLPLGLAAGLWHFGSLRWASRRLVEGGGWLGLVLLQLLRAGLLVALLAWSAHHGAWALAASAAGVLAADAVVVARVRRGSTP
ncbi:MAG: hypothetical protein KGL43_18420 [Burkholderiales bacterium]|nr:hypothetical protein [Burkholderiales bacterium]MDE2455568.1 hypothetical protein [Burkholderiales bacterium]